MHLTVENRCFCLASVKLVTLTINLIATVTTFKNDNFLFIIGHFGLQLGKGNSACLL